MGRFDRIFALRCVGITSEEKLYNLYLFFYTTMVCVYVRELPKKDTNESLVVGKLNIVLSFFFTTKNVSET